MHNVESETHVRYTTAPEAYDGFSTRTVEPDCGKDGGKTVRKVTIAARDLAWQEGRYASGMYGSLDRAGYDKLRKAGLITQS